MAHLMTDEADNSHLDLSDRYSSDNPGDQASSAMVPSSATDSQSELQLLEKLHDVFGFRAFRGAQDQVVSRIMAGQSTLAVMPTGAGKSLTYQLPATMLDGTCIVISPLIALMHDQLRSAAPTASAPRL